MNKYLLEILKEVNMIIIPGLGALTITDASTGEVMFMPYLKHDDGRLSSYIAEKEGIDEIEAKNIISKFVREITNTLDQGESYDMFQFGSFHKDEEGEIQFKNWDNGDVQPAEPEEVEHEAPVTPPVAIEPENDEPKESAVNSATTENKIEEKSEAKSEVEPSSEEKGEEEQEPVHNAPETDSTEKETISKSDKKIETEKKKELNILEKEEQEAVQAKLEALKEKKQEEKKKKKGVLFYAIIVFIVVLLSGTAFIIYDFESAQRYLPFLASDDTEELADEPGELDKMKEMLGKEDSDTDGSTDTQDSETSNESDAKEDIVTQPEIAEETMVKPDNTKVVEEVRKETPKQAPPVMKQLGNYHIIAGTFAIEQNALNYMETLKSQGINSTIVEESGLYQISLGSYGSRQEASSALSSMNLSVTARVHEVD